MNFQADNFIRIFKFFQNAEFKEQYRSLWTNNFVQGFTYLHNDDDKK